MGEPADSYIILDDIPADELVEDVTHSGYNSSEYEVVSPDYGHDSDSERSGPEFKNADFSGDDDLEELRVDRHSKRLNNSLESSHESSSDDRPPDLLKQLLREKEE